MPSSSVVPRKIAEVDALKHLRKVPDAAILSLQKSLEDGTFDGNQHRTCFFGHLAAGAGYDFTNKVRPERTLGQFLRNLGLHRVAGELEPIEFYCRAISPGMTILDSERARELHSWCDNVLNERSRPAAEALVEDTFNLTEYRVRRVALGA